MRISSPTVPCRRNCAMQCPTYEWSHYLLNDGSDWHPGARLGFLISWGRIPPDEWRQAFQLVEDTYGEDQVLDALRWLSTHWTSKTFTEDDRMRAQALASKYERVAA